MTAMKRSTEYRYGGFTFFMGKACSGLAESACV